MNIEPKVEKALKWIVDILNRYEIPFQIAGGFAAHFYGSERPINDIDIDIPEGHLQTVLLEVKDYIIEGPGRINDGKWDLDLIVLNYGGQIIDLCGAYTTKIYNEISKEWQKYPSNFATAQIKSILGIEVPLMDPTELIEYKKILNGEHQKVDIEAIKKYLERKG